LLSQKIIKPDLLRAEKKEDNIMIGTILLILLILLVLGALPAWPYSRGWGYRYSGGLGIILIIVIIVLLLHGHF
jgi:hypothetical protein